ncbi:MULTISPECIES: hypothetical protein [Paenibacillus]|uniref:Uncharacterized protein n=1 Tax=Paenibacillus albilobatus TaxID=2716884 RepID=A0A919XJ76_9BACL|nr:MULTISPECIES: hypothetical protein [Paenibacillus]GIO33196.1 hypothetical protein J2TS6_43370 [Paenibacillus albilobatus]
MKKVFIIPTVVVTTLAGIALGSIFNITAQGASSVGQPGTADDPVVTKSYVDQQIQKALGGGGNTTTTPPTNPTTPTTPPTNPTTPPATDKPSGGKDETTIVENTVSVVTLKPGEKLIAKAGTEFIIRSGKGVVYSEDANGVADLTDGKDIANGQAVGNNHLLSFPRNGRGIMVQDGNKYNLIVMVRGGYSIQ